ncbi:hypothetical protein LL13C18_14310 [Escherichia coli]
MTFKNLRYGLSSSVVLAASLFSVPSYAATDSIGLTVITTVEIGTCTATLVNDSDQDISVVDFGDVYISEINAKTKVKTFKLKFKDCAGIPNKKAQIKLTSEPHAKVLLMTVRGSQMDPQPQIKQVPSPLKSGAPKLRQQGAQHNLVV